MNQILVIDFNYNIFFFFEAVLNGFTIEQQAKTTEDFSSMLPIYTLNSF